MDFLKDKIKALKMDFWNLDWDPTQYLNKLACLGINLHKELNGEDLLPPPLPSRLQITINSKGKGEVKYIFVRSSERNIDFYNGKDFVQAFVSHEPILEWIQQFLLLTPDDKIIWHREGEEGISTTYSEERLLILLKMLVSEQIV